MSHPRPESITVSNWAQRLFPCFSRSKPQVSRHLNLLPELLIVVLLHLHEDLQQDLRCLVYTGGSEFEEHMTTTIARARYTLYSAALVSKAWYRACTPILYAHPILVTPHQLTLFRNIVSEIPTLGQRVKILSIIIVEARPGPKDQDDVLALQERQVHEDVSLLLGSLSAFSSLILQVPNNHTKRCVWDFPQRQTTLDSLQNFTMVRSHLARAAGFRAPKSFVNLQVLYLNSVVISGLFQFPALPNLHTLHILKSSFNFTSTGISHFVPVNFPVLSSVLLHQNSMTLRQVLDLASPQHIRHLELIGDNEVLAFDLLADTTNGTKKSTLHLVKHLVMGNISDVDHPFGQWAITRALESLTMIVDLGLDSASLDVLVQFLEGNSGKIRGGLSSLQKITVNLTLDSETFLVERSQVRIGELLESVKQICRELDLRFEEGVIHFHDWFEKKGGIPRSLITP